MVQIVPKSWTVSEQIKWKKFFSWFRFPVFIPTHFYLSQTISIEAISLISSCEKVYGQWSDLDLLMSAEQSRLLPAGSWSHFLLCFNLGCLDETLPNSYWSFIYEEEGKVHIWFSFKIEENGRPAIALEHIRHHTEHSFPRHFFLASSHTLRLQVRSLIRVCSGGNWLMFLSPSSLSKSQ